MREDITPSPIDQNPDFKNQSELKSEKGIRFLNFRNEIALIIFMFIGVALKLSHSSIGNSFLILSTCTASLFYMLIGIFWSSDSRFEKIFGIFVPALGLSILLIGILGKLEFWIGMQTQLRLGVFIMMIATPLTLILFLKTQKQIFRNFFLRCFLFGATGVILFFTSNVKLLDIISQKNTIEKQLFKNYLEHPNDPKAHEAFEKYLEYKRDSLAKI